MYTRHDGYRSSSSNWVGAIQFNCLVILEYQTDVRRCSFEYKPSSLLWPCIADTIALPKSSLVKYLWQPQWVGGPAQPYLTPSKIHMVTTEYGENTTEPSNSYCSRQSFFMSDITSYERLHAVASCQWLVKCSLWWFSDETHYSCIDESFPDRSMHHRAYRPNLPPVQNIPPLKRRRAGVWRLVSQPKVLSIIKNFVV